MKLERALVISQEEVYENTFLMWLRCAEAVRGASPGRFVMIRCGEADDPLLGRPMSYHRFRGDGAERQFAILYDVRGRGTSLLSRRRQGDEVGLFGPLGRGYSLSKESQNVLLVAGGLGVAAVVAAADECIADGKSVTLLQGARTSPRLLPPELLPPEVEAVSATDDGSSGHKSYVTQLLPEYLGWADQVLACGPNAMFASMADELRRARSRKPVQALLEERMGCGTGVCYGCAVFTPKGVKLVCRDGPRFELRDVFR